MTLRAVDVCAGAGGLSTGLQRAGFDVVGVERDPEAVDVHRRHVGPCELADVETWSPSGPADLVAGGVPCQPFSTAGKRLGVFDPRGSLFRHLVRIAVEANASAVLLENVMGLYTWQGGAAFRAIGDCMREAGFTFIVWTILDAADFGVPQHRRRLFVVGFRERVSLSWPLPTHGPSLWARRPWVSVREALGLGPARRAKGRIDGATGWNGQRLIDVDEPGYTINTRRNPDLLDLPAPTITTLYDEGRDKKQPSRRPQAELRAQLKEAGLSDRPATAIQAHGSGRVAPAGHHDRQWNGAVRLGVEQCATLQGFPDGWEWPKTKTAAHRCIGNAVLPALGEAVGRSIVAALLETRTEAA